MHAAARRCSRRADIDALSRRAVGRQTPRRPRVELEEILHTAIDIAADVIGIVGFHRRRPHHAAEPVNPPAFKIYAAEDRFFYARLALFKELMGLLRVHDVAAEKNKSARLHFPEQFRRLGVEFFSRHTGEDQLTK